MRFRIGFSQIVAIIGGYEGYGELPAEISEGLVHHRLLRQHVGLNLNVETVVVEEGGKLPCLLPGFFPAVFMDQVGDAALEARRERDQPPVVFAQELHIDPWVIVEALEVPKGHEPAEVHIALPVHHEKDEMVGDGAAVAGSGALFAMFRRHIDLAAQNGFDGFLGRFPKKLHCAENVSMIGDGHALHAKGRGPVDEPVDPDGPVEKTVFRVNV